MAFFSYHLWAPASNPGTCLRAVTSHFLKPPKLTRLPRAHIPPSVGTPCDSADRPLYFSPVFPVGLPAVD